MDELLGEFLAETKESLERLDLELVRFEREPNNRDILDNIFRLAHTVKGTCGFFALDRLARLAHAAESLLGHYREGHTATVDGVSAILASIDRIKSILAGIEQTGAEPEGNDEDLIGRLGALVERGAECNEAPAAVEAGEAAPAADAAETASGEEASESGFSSDVAQTVRIRLTALEQLMATVSELVLTRNQLLDIARTFPDTPFKAPLHKFSSVTSELQRGMMKARMLPIARAWQTLPRLVRELSLELDKPLQLQTSGGDTELDRQVLELVRDPITHLIRNAADHGIEAAAVRKAAGKPEVGTIRLNAYPEGGHIVIEIADDGAGINDERIKAKCLEKGLATEAELERMRAAELQQFLFKPGFSTARAVTGISGRGVGLDVVRSNVELIGGSVELKSSSAAGSVFSMRIPLTLAIAAALIVSVKGHRFAIPQHNVAEVVRARPGSETRIEMINTAPQLRLRDRMMPVCDLARILRLGEGAGATVAMRDATVVVIETGSRAYGVLVDEVLRAEEIVAKPKSSVLSGLALFSGNTILGDGSVIMIIDPNALALAAGIGEGVIDHPAKLGESAKEAEAKRTPLLVFRSGPGAKKAIPLTLVTRLEMIPAREIERLSDGEVTRYRGGLMPIVCCAGSTLRREGEQPVLVFAEERRQAGLAVDEIVDVVEDIITVQAGRGRTGVIGAALVQGEIVELLDVSHVLGKALSETLPPRRDDPDHGAKLLLIDDSPFFRNMLAPLLTTSGYEVTLASSAHEALELREEGKRFDVIVSDLEMPEMDGIALAKALKADGRWAEVPMIALSSHASPHVLARSRAAGFADSVGKFDRIRLMDTLAALSPDWGEAA